MDSVEKMYITTTITTMATDLSQNGYSLEPKWFQGPLGGLLRASWAHLCRRVTYELENLSVVTANKLGPLARFTTKIRDRSRQTESP